MYHSIILEDLLDLLNLAGVYHDALPVKALIPAWRTTVQGMRRWLKTLCHPDGEISFFNDAALDIACSPLALEDYAGRLGLGTLPEPEAGITHLPDSGYIRLQQNFTIALLDVGPVGPDYSPGHAHADTGLDHRSGHVPPTDTELWAVPTLVCPAWAKTCNLKRGCRRE